MNPSTDQAQASNALAMRSNHSVSTVEEAQSITQVLQQVQLVQQVMRQVMTKGEHFGTVPGCGDKMTLLKPGAEKLGFTFRLAPSFIITTRDVQNGHREYEINCSLHHIQSGRLWGSGVGSCTTMESKYRFRSEKTGLPVPKEYWDRKDKNLLGGDRFEAKKLNGQWEIVERVEHDNPADYYNTVLKMAKKRAHVDAILTATAASDIFTQDLEDIQGNADVYGANDAPPAAPARAAAPAARPAPRPAAPARAQAVVVDVEPADTVNDNEITGADWKVIEIHFGKNKGMTLGKLPENTLTWYCREWSPKEYPAGSGKYAEADVLMRRALNAAMDELGITATV